MCLTVNAWQAVHSQQSHVQRVKESAYLPIWRANGQNHLAKIGPQAGLHWQSPAETGSHGLGPKAAAAKCPVLSEWSHSAPGAVCRSPGLSELGRSPELAGTGESPDLASQVPVPSGAARTGPGAVMRSPGPSHAEPCCACFDL